MHIVSVDFCVDQWCQRRQTFSWERIGVQRVPSSGDVDDIRTTLVPVWGSQRAHRHAAPAVGSRERQIGVNVTGN